MFNEIHFCYTPPPFNEIEFLLPPPLYNALVFFCILALHKLWGIGCPPARYHQGMERAVRVQPPQEVRSISRFFWGVRRSLSSRRGRLHGDARRRVCLCFGLSWISLGFHQGNDVAKIF